jgi:hypothetical protein
MKGNALSVVVLPVRYAMPHLEFAVLFVRLDLKAIKYWVFHWLKPTAMNEQDVERG